MRLEKREATREGDPFRAKLEKIINMEPELALLAGEVD